MTNTNYRMPAEWEPQAAIWLSWPHNEDTWPDNLAEAQSEFAALVHTIAATQPVCILAGTNLSSSHIPKRSATLTIEPPHQQAQQKFADDPNITIVDIETNDAWARDYAPTFVKNGDGELVAIDWYYNAWGGKYPPYDADQKVAKQVAEHLGVKMVSPDFCFEGGAIEVNSDHVLLSTRSCALDPNRNPKLTIEQADTLLSKHLGTKQHIWLSGDSIEGDDTDGHIDQLARFVDDQTIVYAWTDDERDPQLAAMRQNLLDLRAGLSKHNLGHYRLIPLPIPAPIQYCDRRIPASYCNFLITNELVIVPQFGQPEDETAVEILTPLFKSRKVVPLETLNLSVGLGSFHCLSQQQPRH